MGIIYGYAKEEPNMGTILRQNFDFNSLEWKEIRYVIAKPHNFGFPNITKLQLILPFREFEYSDLEELQGWTQTHTTIEFLLPNPLLQDDLPM